MSAESSYDNGVAVRAVREQHDGPHWCTQRTVSDLGGDLTGLLHFYTAGQQCPTRRRIG